jgi:hypothetical protein
MATGSQPTAQQLAQQAAVANLQARALIVQRCPRMLQQIFSTTLNGSGAGGALTNQQNVVNIPVRPVGLVRGFIVKVSTTVKNTTGGGVAITPSDFGAANSVSQFTMTDLQNNQRVLTSGWHLNFLNSIKGRMPFGTALVNTAEDGINAAGGYGSNWSIVVQPASIADTATGVVTMWYYLPLSYTPTDLRGSIFANVVNAVMQISIALNTVPVGDSGADTTFSMYKAAAGAGNVQSATITIWQDYLDQIPVANGQYVLPNQDLATIYGLTNTTQTGMVVNQDFPVQYANFRDFLSTFSVYNSTGANGRNAGSDIVTWALQSANFTNLWKVPPEIIAMKTRAHMRTDFPKGTYYFDSREHPISTVQYGNMELVLNASTATPGSAYLLMGYEYFALQNIITQAGSLPVA